ncbi:MAG: DUF4920 domain-containing protein [Pseudomonadota bacterium]
MFRLMITGIALLSCCAAAFADETAAIRLSEPVAITDTYEDFGQALPTDPVAQSLADALAAYDGSDKPVTVTARIEQVCQKKGCFFIAQDGDAMARVTFVDYSFFVPTDSSGKTVTFVGTIEQHTLSSDEAAHVDADMGVQRDHYGPRSETRLVASAVRIPRS